MKKTKAQENTMITKFEYDTLYDLYKNECEVNKNLEHKLSQEIRENEELRTSLVAINRIIDIKLH